MSHRALDEVVELEAQLHEIDVDLMAALAADVVDLSVVADARRKRQSVMAWLQAAREAVAP